MKKFSLCILFIIIVSLVASCGISGMENNDLGENKNIVEKPKEEKETTREVEGVVEENKEVENEEVENQYIIPENLGNKNAATPVVLQTLVLKVIEKKGYVTVDGLNVRNLGSMKGKILTSINKGVEVHIFGEKDNWYYVEYAKNKRGWVYSRYIQFEKIKEPVPKDPPKEEPDTPKINKIEKKGYVTVNDLNVRNLGSMKGKILTSINKGVEVHVFGEKDNWYYVEYAKDKKGWVYSRYIQFEKIKSSPIDTSLLSNKSYNWYFVRNNKHQQPGFDKSYKSMLDKYQGIAIGNKNKKDIFLTFDNGYENGYTNKILDILKRQNIKVGFFVQGTYIDKNPEIVRRMVKEGHIILNHTNNHPQMPTLSKEKLRYEINIVEEKYKKVTGKDMLKFIRPPSGTFSERTLAESKNLGYRSVFWSMAYRDWVVDDQPGKQASYKHVTDNIHNGAVILLHSVSKSNTEALEDIIKELKRQGYNFKLLTQYP